MGYRSYTPLAHIFPAEPPVPTILQCERCHAAPILIRGLCESCDEIQMDRADDDRECLRDLDGIFHDDGPIDEVF